jgi:hypothetical protein
MLRRETSKRPGGIFVTCLVRLDAALLPEPFFFFYNFQNLIDFASSVQPHRTSTSSL